MEVRRFWFLNSQIERLRAEEQIVLMRTNASITTAEGFRQTFDHYKETMGIIATFNEVPKHINLDETQRDPDFDQEAFLALKRSMGQNS